MNLGVAILYKTPTPEDPGPFSFLKPLDQKVWLSILVASAMMSVGFFVVARLSPNQDQPKVTFKDSIWFTAGALLQQGIEISPRSTSSRILACTWWFFTLIFVMFYTANLAAFLTVQRMDSPINNADDLAKQVAIKYGTMTDGSTAAFFQNSKVPTMQKMWASMMETNANTETQNDGIRRVLGSGGCSTDTD